MDNADERIGTLACRRAKLTSVNVVNENYQGLGTEGSETPHLGDLNFLKKNTKKHRKLGHGTGSQLPVEVPSLMEDIPSSMMWLLMW